MVRRWHTVGVKFLCVCFSFFSSPSWELLIAVLSQEGFWAADRQLAGLQPMHLDVIIAGRPPRTHRISNDKSFFIPGWFRYTRDGPQEGRVPGSHDHHTPLL